jgi:hypothetical protein
MKRIQGFVAGFLTAIVLLVSVPTLAETITTTFNVINIKINGEMVVKSGESFILANGNKVPYTIVYNGTTYLPLRETVRLVGKDLAFDGDTSTADIIDKPIQQPIESPKMEGDVVSEKKYVTMAELSRFLVRSFELSDNGTRYDLPDVEKDDEHYVDICIALQHEYVFPNTKGYFTPQYQLTRRQYLYTMLYRVYKLNIDEGQAVTKEIVKDADKYSDQLLKEIGAALELGLLPLYEDGTFRLYDPLVMDLTPNKNLQNYLQK